MERQPPPAVIEVKFRRNASAALPTERVERLLAAADPAYDDLTGFLDAALG